MHRRTTLAPTALAAVVLLGAAFMAVPTLDAVAGAQAKKAAAAQAAPDHPEVDPLDSCEGCHEELSPDVVAAWSASPHGQNGVKCFVCHGSAGPDFKKAPAADGCVGCHPVQAESMGQRPITKGKSCFTCHAPHALNPHWSPEPGGQR